MKKVLLLISLAFVLAALALPATAYANYAIHGNYVQDTDACAGCHRAHTAVSTITWTSSLDSSQHSALLVTSATQAWQFCYACHDATSQGADTNVQQGIYEGTLPGNTQFGPLNGGGFDEFQGAPVTSTHVMNGTSWGAFGGGLFAQGVNGATGQLQLSAAGQPGADTAATGESIQIKMDCVTCHDPHGSANYRILKAVVNGNPVGGYQPTADPEDPDPDGFVSSVEPGWPVNGFRLHQAYAGYQPNYTTAMYAKGYDQRTAVAGDGTTGLDTTKGMSGWCAGCHSTYLRPQSELTKETADGGTATYTASATMYNANDGMGYALRHRHPINVGLDTYYGPDRESMIVTAQALPLDHGFDEAGAVGNQGSDWIECLTCHRAHGTAAVMTGWASEDGARSILDTDGVSTNNVFVANEVSALLRRDNRGVCEACHNK